jgi:hypothetical protein
MKTPKMKFVVISAIGLASIVGIFVSAQSPTPGASGPDRPFHLVMVCATVDHTKLTYALKTRPSDSYRVKDGNNTVGTLPPMTTPPPCPAAHFQGNATQRAVFASTKELRDFLTAAGL